MSTITKQKKTYDSEFCGSIPLNFVNSTQPHGILMALEKDTFKVIQVSENIAQFTDLKVETVLNRPLEDLAEDGQVDELKQQIQKWPVKDRIPANLRIKTSGKSAIFSVTLHTYDKFYLAELIQIQEEELNIAFLEVYQQIKLMTLALKEAESIADIARLTVEKIKSFAGFGKVMLYRFDEDWNGTVIAEAKEEDMDSYMDLRFPASDVPKQSRELYLKNPYRLIPDIHATPARLIPVINPATNSFTDLSDCNLRSVPKVHVEYMTNMGMTASMSVPVIIHDKLWGLISCHHKEPRYPAQEVLSALELFATLVSTQLAAKERETKLKYKTRVNNLEIKIIEQLYAENDLISGVFTNSADLLQLFNAGGASLVLKNKVISTGEVPNESQTKDLVKWLRRYRTEKVYANHALPEVYEAAREYKDNGSGLMALKLANSTDNYFILYRPEVIRTVAWGGNPNEAINFEDDGKTYHPRNSFKVWKETVHHTSLPWTSEENEAAEKIRVAMVEKIFKL